MLLTVSIEAGWFSSLLNIGHSMQAQMQEHPKITCCAAVICAVTMGYGIFDKLRDREINKRLNAAVEKELSDAVNGFDGSNPVGREIVINKSISAWGKRCDFKIKINVTTAYRLVKIYHNNKLIANLDLTQS
jgi:hypothetical protein